MSNKIDKQTVRFRENSFPAKIAAAKLGTRRVAMVLGKTIHLYGVKKEEFLKDATWVKHELCHVAQFKQYGYVRFLFLYFIEYCRNGYEQNKYEVEARQAEKAED